MSAMSRSILAALVAIALAVTAFMAGYLVNDFVEQRMTLPVAAAATYDGDMPIFQEAWSRIQDNFIGEIPADRQVEYAAIRGSLSALGDPYTLFVEPVARQQEIDSLRGNFGGIGATLQRNDDGDIVLTPIPGNPAEEAGIVDGDVLLAVDGTAVTAEMTVEAVAQQIRGEKGTAVRLTVRHPDVTEPVDIDVVRDDILIPSVSARILPEAPTVGYIQLTRFSGESGSEVRSAIESLRADGALYLILDLRRNGGGLLDAAVDVSDHFIDRQPVLIQLSRGESERIFEASDDTIARDIPLVVLVDESTASASEIVAGSLQDYGRATLVGRQTFGKGSVQLVYDLNDGSSVHVTSARWLTPNRNVIDQQGLTPDVLVEITQEDIDNGRDADVERAVDFLLSGS